MTARYGVSTVSMRAGKVKNIRDFADQQAIKPGSGFFLILRNPVVVKTGTGSIVRADSISKTGIALSAGYNAVGNPFNFDIPKDSLKLADGISLTNITWAYVGQGGTNAGWLANPTTLKAWEGILIKLNAPTTLLFHITDRPHASVHPALAVKRTEDMHNKQPWTVRIKATRTDNGVIDEENILGTSEYIETPLVEPPMVGEKTVSLAFESPDGPITHDLRSPADSGWVWDFNVTTPDKNAEIKLDFIDLEKAGEGYLIDKESKMVYRLNALQQIVTRTNNRLRQYRLIVGSEEFARTHSLGIDLEPREFIVYQNYPNPFNPYTNIRFALKSSAQVRITIYDVLGRKIDQLLDTEINDGYHEVTWEPKAASGVYLYRIEIVPLIESVKPFSIVHKMLYMK